MIRFIEKSNLPVGRVKAVVCGELCNELNLYLDSQGIERFLILPNAEIDSAVKFHADMAGIHLGNNKILLDKKQLKIGNMLEKKGLDVFYSEKAVTGEYPEDIKLNFTIMGNHLIGKQSCADKKLLSLAENFNKINVRQGYCKCSCLVINENALITDDKSIYDIAAVNCIDCLLISKGDISLPEHGYGFIGGASVKISKNQILFFGDITEHRDYKKIAAFIEKYGCEIISLNFPLTDFGGIIPLIEETP